VYGESVQVVSFVKWGKDRCAQWSAIWTPVCHHWGFERQGWCSHSWKLVIHHWWASWSFPVSQSVLYEIVTVQLPKN
jgi:hypothetical protein